MANKVFIRKTGGNGAKLYTWSPDESSKRNNRDSTAGNTKYYCSTPFGSQGDDFITTYSYVIVVLNGIAQRTAYVQCDYVA